MSQSIDIFQQIAALRKRGEIDRALEVLREALRRGGLGPEEVDRAGRFLIKARASTPEPAGSLRVHLLGQCTTSWLVPALTAVAWGHGQACSVAEGGYDTVLQDLEQLAAHASATPRRRAHPLDPAPRRRLRHRRRARRGRAGLLATRLGRRRPHRRRGSSSSATTG